MLLLVATLTAQTASAGLAASEVVVVVNAGSLNSRTLANHYVSLRNIPARNVVVLADVPNSEVITIDEFRGKILRPLLTEIERRNIANHVQCIAYSADFPTAVDISADLKGLELNKVFTRKASINSLTYFYARVLAGDPSYILLDANFYGRRTVETYFTNPGGRSTEEAWQQIQALIADEKHGEAAEALEALFKEHPHQFPLAYLAAAESALAEEKTQAIRLLESAIAAGWNSGHYLANDERFDALRDEADFQLLEFLVDDSVTDLQPASGFDARVAWTPNGVPSRDPKFGFRYLLSAVLGVTRGSGTTLPQAITALQRAAQADYSHPRGGFYFCLTGDVRTTTRKSGFQAAIDELTRMGFEAEIVKGQLPRNKPAVLGAQLGTAKFDWTTCDSQLVPGAIAENLTSLGGVMTSPSGQTKLTELIKAGAAGSSGAVTEPYALQQKFPTSQLYVHYARGASLVEAFYLSVTGPYQLLIVGDPLAMPFSNAPSVEFDPSLRLIDNGQSVSLDLDITGPHYTDWLDSSEKAAERTESLAPTAVAVLFDGVNPKAGLAKPKLEVKVDGQSPGYHEINLRLAADDPLEQRSDAVVPLWVGPRGAVELDLPGLDFGGDNFVGATAEMPRVSLQSTTLAVKITAAEAERVSVWHDWEQVAVAAGNEIELELPLSELGMGPVRLQAKAELPSGTTISGIPVWLNVDP